MHLAASTRVVGTITFVFLYPLYILSLVCTITLLLLLPFEQSCIRQRHMQARNHALNYPLPNSYRELDSPCFKTVSEQGPNIVDTTKVALSIKGMCVGSQGQKAEVFCRHTLPFYSHQSLKLPSCRGTGAGIPARRMKLPSPGPSGTGLRVICSL
jgi:hypothetical protein